ncbi:MAG: flagellar hook-associated protein FlgK [Proteobacteria bacterium]|nr:flagellar hook-associated protein FlgK [Pseudomonadota bacterium]
MADIINTALSGLLAFERSLAVTGNNITNANTPGYSRQIVNLADRQPDASAGVYIGNGVDVGSVNRAYDQFSVDQLRTGSGLLGQQTAFLNIANQVDNLVGGTTNGISSALTAFFNSWQTLASDPTSASNRQQVLSQAQGLANSISQTAGQLDTLQGNINSQITTTVGNINNLTASIAKLNDQIATAVGNAGGAQPNDLLDQRDTLLNQLSSLVNVRTNTESDGSIDVFVGNGQPLVVRNQTTQLSTVPDSYDTSQLGIGFGSGSAQQVITSSISGGTLGGLLQVKTQLIDPTLNGLGRIAAGLASQVNGQQAIGFDQNGQLGKPIFSVGNASVFPNSKNTGGASLTPVATSVGALTTDDYLLRYQGGTWTATAVSTGQAVTVTGTGSVANPLVIGGVSLTLSGVPASNDSFELRPTANAARTIATSLTDPRGIAAAGALQTSAALANAGNATISAGSVANGADPRLLVPATITFLSPTTYQITQATTPAATVSGPFTYTSGATIQAPGSAGPPAVAGGWTVQITGVPTTGDSFSIGPNTSGAGDNRNALAMAQLQSSGVLVGGTVGLSSGFATLVGVVGTVTQQANVSQSAQQAVVNQAQQAVSNVSGVNLDEEAANMLKWQQAYAAAAKVVATADTLFQTLLAAVKV